MHYIGGFFVLALVLMGFMYLEASTEVQRFHQHLERPGEADLGLCLRCTGDELCTHLPIMIIDTGGLIIPGRPIYDYRVPISLNLNRVREMSFRVFETTEDGETQAEASVIVIDGQNEWNHVNDTPVHESLAMIRIRGNSSRRFDKPNYRIRLIHPNGEDNYLPLLGMSPHFEWALHGPFLDKTLMRNYMWMNIAAEVMGTGHFVSNTQFFELIVNGEYQGVYVLMETIRIDPNRLNLTRYRQGMPATSYLVRLDRTRSFDRQVYTFSTVTFRNERHPTEILYPRRSNQSDCVQNYIKRSISTVERLLYSQEMIWYPRIYEQYIDVDSFVNFFIINEFILNNDLWSNSTYFHKDVRGKLVAGPVWDFNNVMDNFFRTMPVRGFVLADRGWFDRLFMCPYFTERVIHRWQELRRGILAEERLVQYMEDVEAWLGSAICRNYQFEVWGYSFNPTLVGGGIRRLSEEQNAAGLTIFDVNPASFEEAFAWKREYMIARGRWLDNNIESLRQFSHPSRHAPWVLQ